jgi:phosphate uptake regulator
MVSLVMIAGFDNEDMPLKDRIKRLDKKISALYDQVWKAVVEAYQKIRNRII